MKISVVKIFLFSLIFALSCPASYAVDISIVGADPGPNETGEIPAYEGHKGLTCPAGFEKGQFLANPYKDEKPLFRIDHTNVDQYKHRLSPGQVERLRNHPDFYMNIYPTHRNVEFSDEYYAATAKNRETCRLDDKNVLQGFNGAVPFPEPKNGVEAIWNVRRMYVGDDTIGYFCRRIVSPSGRIKRTQWTAKVLNFGETRIKSHPFPNPDKVAQKIFIFYTYPADEAGTAFFAINYLDDNRLEDNWVYLPALRRVRRAPSLTGGGQIDGEATMDENGFDFRGVVSDWNWKLLGKKEVYVTNNCYDMFEVGATDKEECHKWDINPERIRYELHRVWVVEGTATKGLNHPYSKRVGYYDEDHWAPVLSERYDKRGNLWRMYESYTYPDYCQKMRIWVGYIYLNLESGRYEVYGGCRKEDTINTIYDSGLKESEFSVQALRKMGR